MRKLLLYANLLCRKIALSIKASLMFQIHWGLWLSSLPFAPPCLHPALPCSDMNTSMFFAISIKS